MSKVILIPATYKGSRDMADKSKRLTFDTQETTPEQAADLQVLVQQYCFLCIKAEPFAKAEEEVISNLKAEYTERGKSPSQIMRATLFVLWEQDPKGYNDFSDYYRHRMGEFISILKTQIIPDTDEIS